MKSKPHVRMSHITPLNHSHEHNFFETIQIYIDADYIPCVNTTIKVKFNPLYQNS